ncbi:hypothetical protein GCM10022631_43080 [Deinococcus rubellus]|uniref:Lipoprotein n=1 Tax=Deinococcus rubellus TaxID=1889240 RepID=A0ABY5YM85_9DEIO|nr:hypothetical protein [Deinococcus rubellus]UWX65217.1 hypothetical protein N0D28_06065 [Deinococcus rubellus]
MKLLAPALLMMAAVTACNRDVGFKPLPISLATHPSVLRGTWNGSTTSQALGLQLTATYDTTRQYQVSGTGSLDSEALTVAGTVNGGSLHSYLKAQNSPAPEFADLTLKRSGKTDLKLTCSADSRDATLVYWFWQCSLPGETTLFELTKGTP